jgi:GNAT superfamily N-acetyltransferase
MRLECARDTRRNRKAILRLINEASTWLRTKDTDQWAEPWPSKKARNGRIRRDLADGKTWIVWDGKTPAATITVADRANPHVWSGCECDLSEPAVYVHRLVTARRYADRGLGAYLIKWAGKRGQLLNSVKWIRIDVWTSNEALHQYYKMAGFEPCGRCTDPAYPSGALFQKPVYRTWEVGRARVPAISAGYELASPAPRRDLAQLT